MIWKTKFDPHCKISIQWLCILVAGVCSLFMDFLFFYIPSLGGKNSLYMDWHFGVRIAILRSVVDLIFLGSMIMRLRTMCTPPKITPVERQKLMKETRYTKTSFIVDLVAVLQIPQVCLGLKYSSAWETLATYGILVQLPFRVIAMSPHYHRATSTGVLTKNAWAGALLNLFYFIMTGHGMGACYYDLYISTALQCRKTVTDRESDAANLVWDELLTLCNKKYGYEFGILSDAFTAKIGTRTLIQKYTYCLAWGLKSLSSFGQIFSASSYPIDTIASFFIVIFGLVLFGDLLARMQTGLQCTEQKEDRQRARQRMVEEWMKHHQLPKHLKENVKKFIQSEWSSTQGINDHTFLDSLPWDIRNEIRRELYLEIIRTMPLFSEMDDHLVMTLCGYLRTFSINEGTYVAFEGEPVLQILFIYSGQLGVSTANNSGPPTILGPGDLCGKELLVWCSHPTTSTVNLPPSTQTIKCLTSIDAFSLRADDVKLLAIQFHHNGKFRRVFQRYAV